MEITAIDEAVRALPPGLFVLDPLGHTEPVFLPASFDLIEFDDDRDHGTNSGLRVLLHANGLAAEPAEQVLLAWVGSAGRQVVVATRRYSGGFPLQETGRADAIHLAGLDAPDGAAPLLPVEVWQQLQTTSGEHDPRWRNTRVVIDSQIVSAEVIDVDRGSFGWAVCGDRVLAFATRLQAVDDLPIRTLTRKTASRYSCDPLTPRTWHEYVACSQAQPPTRQT